MKKLMFLLVFCALSFSSIWAQETISGRVTSSEDGLGLPGVNVVVKSNPSIGAATDIDGKWTLVVPNENVILVFTAIGMQPIEVIATKSSNIEMKQDSQILDEVIVSGVAAGTSKRKLSISVAKVGAEALEEVPATSAAQALQGKVAGVNITQGSGDPGAGANIIIRGATQIAGTQAPLIIVDGVMVDGTLADINVDDIESFEIVKGASAAALYGSRAGNGVIVIMTKSGKHLAEGQTLVRVRNEYTINKLANSYDLAQHHEYKLDDNWKNYNYTRYAGVTYPKEYAGGTVEGISGGREIADDHYMDNPYAKTYDHQKSIFNGNNTYTNYIAVEGNYGRTNFLASFENNSQGGVIDMVDGYKRQNYRVNLQHRLSDKIKLSTNNLIINSETEAPGDQSANLYNGGLFFGTLLMSPDVDIEGLKNNDGQPYQFLPDPWGATAENPLYLVWKRSNNEKRDRVISSTSINYLPAKWINFDFKYAFEKQNTTTEEFVPYSCFERGGKGAQYSKGSLYKYSSRRFDQTAQFIANLQEAFGDFTVKGKLSYLFEKREFSYFYAYGKDFVFDVDRLSVFDNISDVKDITADDEYQEEITRNYLAIASFDYKEKYILDAMYRMDGSSLFGKDERWNPYYRVSAAWRITQDFKIPGVQELKLRAAHGRSGQRPRFSYQYEAMKLSSGKASKNTLGNSDLKPSLSIENEIGLNANFLNRFDLELTYSNVVTKDQFLRAPQATHLGGWKYKWLNAGTLKSKTFEATLAANIIDHKNFKWNARLIFDKTSTEITKLDIPAYQTGPQGQESKLFYIREGETFGTMYGYKAVTSLDELAPQLQAGDKIDNYQINSDGYVIAKDTEGTPDEKIILLQDKDGNNKQVKIGDANPDFNLKFTTSATYKDFQVYMLWDWKQGGDIYNRTAQWLTRDNRWSKMDQFGKPDNTKKTVDYYKSMYNTNNLTDVWVEDGTFLKLREASIYYKLNEEKLRGLFNGFIKGIRIGIIGRNLLTFTNYSGYDPEVQTSTATGSQNFAYDFMGYPNYRSFSASVEIKF